MGNANEALQLSADTTPKAGRLAPQLARFENVLAIRTPQGRVVGFHAHNLQVALLDEDVWQALVNPTSPGAGSTEAEDEIRQWNEEIDPNAVDSNIKQEVRSLTINVAQVCNLKCTYCAAGGDGTYGDPANEVDLSVVTPQIRMLLKSVREGETFRIIFLGGEPLVAPHAIRAIARFCALETAGRGIRMRYDIVTNGTLITPETAELLASLNCHVTISLDGPPEVNDVQRPTRGGLGSTARTLRGLENLAKVRSRLGSVTAGAVFGKHHTGVVATWKFLQPFGFDSIKLDFAAGDHDSEASRAYVEEVAKVADLAFATGGEKELRKLNLFESVFSILDEQSRIHNHCEAGKSHLQVDTRGRFYVCQWFVNDDSEQVGQGTELDLEKLARFKDPLLELNDCRTCWAKHLCGGGCMVVHKLKTGSKHRKDDEFCLRTRSILAKGIEYYAEARYQSQPGE